VQKPSEYLGLQASEMHIKRDCALGPSGTIIRAFEPWWVRGTKVDALY